MHGILQLQNNKELDVAATTNTLLERFPTIASDRLTSLVGITVQVARMVLGSADGKRMAQHLWLFELAGRLKGGLPPGLRSDETIGGKLAPLALLFVDTIEALGALPGKKQRIQWDDEQAVVLEFEEIWYKRRFAKGSPFLDEAVTFAKENPLELSGNQYFVLLLNVAYYLQARQPGLPILLPVSASLASKLETTPVTLGTAISKALREGYLEIVDGNFDLKAGKARSFKFNMDHPALISRAGSLK